MIIGVLATEVSYTELTQLNPAIDWKRIGHSKELIEGLAVDAYFDLSENAVENVSGVPTGIPVFINSVCHTLHEKKLPHNVVRINGWYGFINRPVWEVAGTISEAHVNVLNAIGIKSTPTPDEPGLIAARILSMIINEAYFAKEEQVSTEAEIDIAMKLGTNYPKGPFEWGKAIGLQQILSLLDKLSETDPRYTPASLLRKEANEA
jgi:3-hydroxybutyryl-CoA dehydrogenase